MAVLGNETTHESATISWVTTLTDPGEFKRFVIEYKKKLVSRDVESPGEQSCYEYQPRCEILGLESAMTYEIRVKVDTVNFGESELAGPVIVKTDSLSDSDLSAVEQLEIQMVNYILIKNSYILEFVFSWDFFLFSNPRNFGLVKSQDFSHYNLAVTLIQIGFFL